MKKVLIFIGKTILVIIVLIIVFIVWQANKQVVSKDYNTRVTAGGDIEKQYLEYGKYEVSVFKKKTDDSLEKIYVYYPSELKTADKKYPAVVYSNGTGQKGRLYKHLYRHLASYGFIVIANDDPESYSGLPAEKSLSFILEENENNKSIFYQKVDLNNIGTYGHSQGGAAVFNTITAQQHSSLYKAAVSMSPTNEELADRLGWHFDLSKISIPVLVFAGTEGSFEIETVIPYEKMVSLYEKINVPKAMARKTGYQHGDTVTVMDGYVTARFMWQLQGDENAAKAFIGDDPELLRNSLYQDQRIDY